MNCAIGDNGRWQAGYRRVAGFFTKRYTNRSRHRGTAMVPTTSVTAIRCNSMRVVSPEAKVTAQFFGPNSTKVLRYALR